MSGMSRSPSAALTRLASPRPSTRRGRAAHNALAHGLRSLIPVIPGVESEEEWLAHIAGVVQGLAPVGQIEQLMAERIALDFWRLKRVARYETLLVIHSDPDSRPDQANGSSAAAAAADGGDADDGQDDDDDSEDIDDDEWEQIEAQLPEQARDLLHRFDLVMFADETQSIAPADALAVVDAIRGRICAFPLSSFAVPDTKDVPLTDCAAWTAGLVRRTIRAICERFQKDPASEISHTVHFYRQVADRDSQPSSAPPPTISPLARHPLPPAHILDRLLRYEAHLTRDLRLWLSDLERWQARRQDRQRVPFDLLPSESAETPVSAKRNGSSR